MLEKLKNPILQQYLLELLIPLLGYYFFNWSISIILAFYLIDQLAAEIAFTRRISRASKEQKTQNFTIHNLIFFLSSFTVFIGLLFLFWPNAINISTIQLKQELTVFGKEEAWFLIPLVILLYHFKDTMTYYMPRRYLKLNPKKAFYGRMILNGGIYMLSAIGIFIQYIIHLNDEVFIIGFIGIKIVFDLTVTRKTTAMAQTH